MLDARATLAVVAGEVGQWDASSLGLRGNTFLLSTISLDAWPLPASPSTRVGPVACGSLLRSMLVRKKRQRLPQNGKPDVGASRAILSTMRSCMDAHVTDQEKDVLDSALHIWRTASRFRPIDS